MSGAGAMDWRAAFDAPVAGGNGQGGTVVRWVHRCTVWAGVRWLRGGEMVLQSRLAGRQPAVVTVHRSPETREIGTDWRLRLDDGSGVEIEMAIRAVVPSDDWAHLEFTAEAGVPA